MTLYSLGIVDYQESDYIKMPLLHQRITILCLPVYEEFVVVCILVG